MIFIPCNNWKISLFMWFFNRILNNYHSDASFSASVFVNSYEMNIVPFAIWNHLFLEFWLVDTWFFYPPTWQTCCNSPRKCTPIKYKARQNAEFSIVTYTTSMTLNWKHWTEKLKTKDRETRKTKTHKTKFCKIIGNVDLYKSVLSKIMTQ